MDNDILEVHRTCNFKLFNGTIIISIYLFIIAYSYNILLIDT